MGPDHTLGTVYTTVMNEGASEMATIRITRVYTRTGDDGMTALVIWRVSPRRAARIEAYVADRRRCAFAFLDDPADW